MVESRFVFHPYLFPHSPNIFHIVKGVFTPEQCDAFVTVADTYPSQESTIGYEEATPGGTEEDTGYSHRKSFISWIPQDNDIPVLEHLWQKFHDTMLEANKQFWDFDLKFMWEQAQYTRYGVKGHFGYHMDVGADGGSSRKITAVMLLNDPEEWEGGELHFFGDRVAQMEKGDMVVFPSYLPHRVTLITKGIRKSIVLWAGGCFYK